MAQSRHATGSARTRRSLDNQRDGPSAPSTAQALSRPQPPLPRSPPTLNGTTPCYPLNSSATTSPSRRYCAPTEGPPARPDRWAKAPGRIRLGHRARCGLRWEDAEVAEDAGGAQARMLVGLLRDEITEISDKLKAPDSDVHRRTEHGHHQRVRRAAVLRRQFYEAHRLLDGLHRRFPETLDASHPRRAARRGVSSAARSG